MDKENAEQEAREKAAKEEGKPEQEEKEATDVKEGPEEAPHDDQGIKEPEKEPIKVKRDAGPKYRPDLDSYQGPVLEKETSGLKHLRRRRLEESKS